MIKKYQLLNCILLIALSFGLCLHADEECEIENKHSLYYLKLGAQMVPGVQTVVLPGIGLGARYQWERHGCDISINASSLVFFNYFSLKALYLHYPMPERKHQLYFGCGPSIGYYAGGTPGPSRMGGGRCNEYTCLNLEGVVGYEFRHARHFKPFVQLELTQPVVYMHTGINHRKGDHAPGVAITGGLGF